MLLPRFTIRLLLLAMVGVAVLALLFTYALRGEGWAIGPVAAVVTLLISALVYAVFYVLVSLLSVPALKAVRRQAEANPSEAPRPPVPEARV